MPAVEATHRPSARPAASGLGHLAERLMPGAAHSPLAGLAQQVMGGSRRGATGARHADEHRSAWPRYLARCAGRGALGQAGAGAIGDSAPGRVHSVPERSGNSGGGLPASLGLGGIGAAVEGGLAPLGPSGSAGGGFGGSLIGWLRSGAGALGDMLSRGLGVLSGPLRALLPALPPMLLPWLSPGPAPWLAQRISEGLHAIGAPLRALNPMGAIQAILGTAGRWAQRAAEGVGALASGTCASVMDSVVNLPSLLRQLAGGVGAQVQRLLQPIGSVLDGIWRSSVSPIAGWMAQQAGGVWGFIRSTGERLWQGTAGLRAVPGRVWDFVSQHLFGGSSAVGWLTGQAERVWQGVRGGLGHVWGAVGGALERVRELAGPGGLATLWNGGMAGALGMAQAAAAPLGGVMNRVGRALQHGVGLARQPGGMAALVSGMLPQIDSVGSLLRSGEQWLSAKVGVLGAAVGGALGLLRGNPVTAPLAAGLEAVGQGVARTMQWGQGVAGQGLRSLGRTLGFMRPVFNAVLSVGRRAAGLLPRLWGGARSGIGQWVESLTQSAQLMASEGWRRLPCCIRDPLAQVLNRLIGQAVFQVSQPPGVHRGGGGIGGLFPSPPRWLRSVLQTLMNVAAPTAWRGGLLGGLVRGGVSDMLRRLTHAPQAPHGPDRSTRHISDTTPCSRHVMAAMVQRLAEGAARSATGGGGSGGAG